MIASPARPTTANFKALALTEDDLRTVAPSVFSPTPMAGLSSRYTFVPTSEVVGALGDRGWVPVEVQQQRVRLEARWGFQKHLVRFRRVEQMRTLDEWNVELVLINSHDALSAYVLRVGIFRRISSNGLVVSDRTFEAIRFRHSGLTTDHFVEASHRIVEGVPRSAARVEAFRNRFLTDSEAHRFAVDALALNA